MKTLFVLVLTLLSTLSFAQITVDSDPNFSTNNIQTAIDFAQSNDIIRIPGGNTYAEYLQISKNLTLLGIGGQFTLTPPDCDTCYALEVLPDAQVRIEKMDIKNFKGLASLRNSGKLSMESCSLIWNDSIKGQIVNSISAELRMESVYVHFNGQYASGDLAGGINNYGFIEAIDCFINNNTGLYGGTYNTGEIFIVSGQMNSNMGQFGAFRNDGILLGYDTMLSANNGSLCTLMYDPRRGQCNKTWLYFIQ